MKHLYPKLTAATILLVVSIFFSYNFSSAAIISKSNSSNNLNTGLVGWWTFDGPDMTAATTIDKSGVSGSGTRRGGVKVGTGKIGQALKFDGVDDAVYVSNTSSISFVSTTSFSLSAWVKTSVDAERIVAKYEGAPYYTLSIGGDGGANKAYFGIRGAGGGEPLAKSTTNVTDNKWHLITGVRDVVNDRIYLYFDGVREANTADISVGDFGTASGLQIGCHGTSVCLGQYFNGLMDDVRVYNRALLPYEVSQLYSMGGTKISKTDNTKLTLKTGLAGHWTFDGKDLSTTTSTDRSGSGFHGTRTGTVGSVGKIGQALKFNGVNVAGSNVVTLPATGDYNVRGNMGRASNENWSVSAWYKGTDTTLNGNWGTGLVSWNSANIFASFILRSGFAEFIHYNGAWDHNIKSTTFVADNKWHNITYVNFSDNTGSLYIDGIEEVSRVSSTIEGGFFYQPYHIGAVYNNVFTEGTIDDVRIYNRALSSVEIQQLYTQGGGKINKTNLVRAQLRNGLVGHWTFDGKDVTVNTTTDMSGQGNHGTRTAVTPVVGKIGQAMKFNGTTSYIDVGNAASLNPTAVTVSAWVKFNSFTSAYSSIYAKHNGSSLYHVLYVKSNGKLASYVFANTTVNYDGTGTITLVTGKWYHLVMTYSSSTGLKGYVNAVLDRTEAANGPLADNPAPHAYISKEVAPSRFVDGSIDDVRIYNRALSPAEVMELYRMGR